MRMPISLALRATAYDITPYNPIAAIRIASAPKNDDRLVLRIGRLQVYGFHSSPERGRKARGISFGPDLEIRGGDGIDRLEIRNVKAPHRLGAKIVVLRVAHHADDFHPHAGAGKLPADWIRTVKIERRHRLIDDSHARRARHLVIAHIAAEQDLCQCCGCHEERLRGLR